MEQISEYKTAYGAYKWHYGARAFVIEWALYVLHTPSVHL